MTGRAPAVSIDAYRAARVHIAAAGHGGDIAWSEGLGPPADAATLAREAIWVICNSGMKHTVARGIFRKVMPVLEAGGDPIAVFGHAGKAAAMRRIWTERTELLAGFLAAADPVAWCGDLPWIGPITRWHLAKNLGVDCAKPDRWLVRLAALDGSTVDGLCRRLAAASGDRVATVDVVLWRACAIGVIRIGPHGIAVGPAPDAPHLLT